MNLAISTNSLAYDTPTALQRAADLGFKYVEVNIDSDEFGYGYRRRPNVRFYRDLNKQITALGLNVWSVTVPALTAEQAFSSRARKEILLNCAGAAGLLGAKVLVVDPAHIFTDEDAFDTYLREKKAPPTVVGFDEMWAQVVNHRMTLALRNTAYYLGNPLTNNVGRMEKITFDLGIGWACDVPQATQRNQLANWLPKLGDRLAVAYLYEVAEDGVTALTASAETLTTTQSELANTRLKCLVLHGHPDQDDAEFAGLMATTV